MKKILFLLVLCLLFTTTSCIITNEEVVKGTIDITVDAKKMTVSIDDDADFYEVDIKNSDDLQYIIITIEIINDEYLPRRCKLIVNDKEIDKKKYEINEDIITYKMEDPNWSDFI